MEILDLDALIDEHLELAYSAHSGRSSCTLAGGREHDLRQTLIVLAGGNALHEHDSPGEATLQVLRGEATFTAGDGALAMSAGDFLVIPPIRHGLEAVTDCAVVLTVATRGER
ncbi:cupin domain-containing protein [Demequina globuliformis]|uniref:cupin domain-containing protein n=1 Tax=Demequina globuliformis TaxID=676202 RepID=UPI0007819D09|nr:cupin domain-containing protein [Demequina globuliformis]